MPDRPAHRDASTPPTSSWSVLCGSSSSTTSPRCPTRSCRCGPSDESWELEREEMLEALAGEAFVLVARRDGASGRLRLRLRRGPGPRLVHRRQARRCWPPVRGRGGARRRRRLRALDAMDAELERRGDRGRRDRRRHRQRGRGAPLREPRLPAGLPDLLRLARRQAVGLPAARGRGPAAGRGRFAPPGPGARRRRRPVETDAVPAALPEPVDRAPRPGARSTSSSRSGTRCSRGTPRSGLCCRCAAPSETWERRRRQYEGWLADEGSFVLVARRDGRAVGYILVAVARGRRDLR